jgi:hypothetical protein
MENEKKVGTHCGGYSGKKVGTQEKRYVVVPTVVGICCTAAVRAPRVFFRIPSKLCSFLALHSVVFFPSMQLNLTQLQRGAPGSAARTR